MPPTTSQVQAAVALLAASTHGNGISGANFPPTAGIRRADHPVAAPDSSSSDTSTPSSAAALAALIAASASSSAAAASSTSQADSNVAMKAYHDYLTLTINFSPSKIESLLGLIKRSNSFSIQYRVH